MRNDFFILIFFIAFFILDISDVKSQNYRNNLIDSISDEWFEESLSRSRKIVFKRNGTFKTFNIYDKNYLITGRYWVYDTPEEASVAFQEMVETEQIKGELNCENQIAKYMDKAGHPDSKTHHGFIMEHVYLNKYAEWTVGVWKIEKHVIELREGWSKAYPDGIFYFRGRQYIAEGF